MTTLKDNLIDAWYTDADGRERTVEVEVHESTQEQGAQATEDFVHDQLESLAPAGNDRGFTQSW